MSVDEQKDLPTEQVHSQSDAGENALQTQEGRAHAAIAAQGYNPNRFESVRGLPGAAFNTTPIYDAQGSLVGLQPPVDNNIPNETLSLHSYAGNIGFVAPYGVNHNFGPLGNGPYYGYNTPKMPMTPTLMPHQASMYHQSQRVGLCEPNTGQVTAPTLITDGKTKRRPFDTCPTFCSVFAILCCPITIWCSLPALVYSICAYADHRTGEEERCQHKSDIARHLVISACVIGLLLCVTWIILAFFYHDLILTAMIDMINVLKNRVYSSGGK